MRKRLSLIVVFCCLGLLATPLASAGSRDRDLPHRYLPGSLDGSLVQTLNPLDGTLWTAWAYRNGAEYDVAVAFRDELGFWSEPMLLGVDDGLDQKQPALVADHWGNVYLAFVEDAPGRIMLCWLEAGASDWTSPQPLTGPNVPAMYPALGVVAERLVVAFRSRKGSVILDLPLLNPVMNTTIFNDGPDPVESSDPVVPRDDEEGDPILPLDDGGTAGSSSSAR